MSIKYRIIRAIAAWMVRRWPYILMEMVIPQNSHVHKNPRKRPRVVAIEARRIEV